MGLYILYAQTLQSDRLNGASRLYARPRSSYRAPAHSHRIFYRCSCNFDMLGEPRRTFYDRFYIVNPLVTHQYMIVDHRGWDSLLPKSFDVDFPCWGMTFMNVN